MKKENREILIDVKKLEGLLRGKRILNDNDLAQFCSFLYRLWEQGKDVPEDFRQKLFTLEQYFRYYIMDSPGPFRPSKSEEIARLTELLPPVH